MFVSESDSDTKVSKFIVNDGVHGDGDDDDDDDDDENKDDPNGSSGSHSMRKNSKNNGRTKKKNNNKKKAIGDLIAKAKKHLIRQNPTPNSKKGSSFSPPTPSVSGNNRVVGSSSCFCFNPPCGLGSSAESHTSDPNHPDFTVDMLKSLIQTNEFYSSECNPHLLSSPSAPSSPNG